MFLLLPLLAFELLILILLFAVGLYLVGRRRNEYWRARGIPGPRPVPIKGNLGALYGKCRPAIFQKWDWTAEFGPVYGFQEGWANVLVISDPDMVHQLLVTKFEFFHGHLISPINGDVEKDKSIHMFEAKGKRWKRLRSVANPAFSIRNLKKIMPTLSDSVRVTMDFLDKACQRGEPIDLHTYWNELTLDVIARVAMGQRESRQFRSEYLRQIQDSFPSFDNNWMHYCSLLFPWLGRNVIRHIMQFTFWLLGNPLVLLLEKLTKTIKERKKEREKGGEKAVPERDTDFIDLLLDAEADDESVFQRHEQIGDGRFDKAAAAEKLEKKNTLEEIAMTCFLFLLAGSDTTANSLATISHLLVTHPEVQQHLRQEIESVCGDEEEISYEKLAQLKYTEAVVKETLRLWPIGASAVHRVCAETTSLGEITVEKGIGVQVDVFSLHRSKTLWGEDADEFKPERWMEANGEGGTEKQQRPLASYLPFGGGPRICIGMRLAMMEVKLALAQLIRRFRLLKCAETKELEFTGQFVLNPKEVMVRLEARI